MLVLLMPSVKAYKQPYVKIGLTGYPIQRIKNLQLGTEDLAHDAMEKSNRGQHVDNQYVRNKMVRYPRRRT